MKRLLIICAGFALLTAANAAFGDLVPIGDPVETGSWNQLFNESGVGPFDFVAVKMVSTGDFFESPTHTNLAAGWTEHSSPTVAYADGPGLTNMTWTINFEGAQGDPLVFDFYAYWGNTWLECARATWTGSGWSISPWDSKLSRSEIVAAVPVPAAVLLGLLGLGTARMKLRKHV